MAGISTGTAPVSSRDIERVLGQAEEKIRAGAARRARSSSRSAESTLT